MPLPLPPPAVGAGTVDAGAAAAALAARNGPSSYVDPAAAVVLLTALRGPSSYVDAGGTAPDPLTPALAGGLFGKHGFTPVVALTCANNDAIGPAP